MVSDISGEFVGTTQAPPTGDRVELTDLEVIQRWSLAVRGASAERSEVIAALRADLAWVEGRRAPAGDGVSNGAPAPRRTTNQPRATATTRSTPPRSTAKKSTAKKAAAKKSTGRSSSARGGARRR